MSKEDQKIIDTFKEIGPDAAENLIKSSPEYADHMARVQSDAQNPPYVLSNILVGRDQEGID